MFVNYQGLKPCARIVASHLSDGGDPAIAMAYIAGQTVEDVTELLPESGPSLAVSHRFSLVFVDTASIDCK